jgi:hypothetical protein
VALTRLYSWRRLESCVTSHANGNKIRGRDPCKAIRNLPVAAINKQSVKDVLAPMWPTHHESASRLRNRIENILDMAKAHDYRTGDNPAVLSVISELLPKLEKRERKHLAAVPYKEMGNFVAALREREGSAERALEFLIYTLGPTGEILGARWPRSTWKRGSGLSLLAE